MKLLRSTRFKTPRRKQLANNSALCFGTPLHLTSPLINSIRPLLSGDSFSSLFIDYSKSDFTAVLLRPAVDQSPHVLAWRECGMFFCHLETAVSPNGAAVFAVAARDDVTSRSFYGSLGINQLDRSINRYESQIGWRWSLHFVKWSTSCGCVRWERIQDWLYADDI